MDNSINIKPLNRSNSRTHTHTLTVCMCLWAWWLRCECVSDGSAGSLATSDVAVPTPTESNTHTLNLSQSHRNTHTQTPACLTYKWFVLRQHPWRMFRVILVHLTFDHSDYDWWRPEMISWDVLNINGSELDENILNNSMIFRTHLQFHYQPENIQNMSYPLPKCLL